MSSSRSSLPLQPPLAAAGAHHAAASSTAAAAASVPVAAAASAAAASTAAPAASASSQNERPMLPYGCRSVTRFEKLNLIGEGTYGTVYRARDRSTGDIVALKKIRPMKSSSGASSGGGFPLTSVREIALLQRLSHPSIIRLREVVVGRKVDNIFLVFDYCTHDLASLVERMSRPFAEAEVKQLLMQLLEATAYLHANFMLHLGSESYHSAVDVWAIGCIFGELLHHRPLLPGKSELHQLSLICQLLGAPNEKIWPGFLELHAKSGGGPGVPPLALPNQAYNNLSHEFPTLSEAGLDLLSRLLTLDPAKRITAEKARAHPYFLQEPLPCPLHLMPTFGQAASQLPPQPTAPLPASHHAPPASAPPAAGNEAAVTGADAIGASRKRKNEDAVAAAAADAADAESELDFVDSKRSRQ